MKGEPIYCFPEFIEVLSSIRRDSTTFVETGTSGGHGVKCALFAGFEKIYSMEIHEDVYNNTIKIFQDAEEPLGTKMFLYLGDSKTILPKILELIPKDEPSVFFLDAHDHIYGVSAYKELDIIATHSLKNHTILIDDIPLYFGDGSELKKVLLGINPEYKFEFVDCEIRKRNPLPGLTGIDIRLLAYV